MVTPDDRVTLTSEKPWRNGIESVCSARWVRDTYERIYEQVFLLPEEERMRPGRENPSRCW